MLTKKARKKGRNSVANTVFNCVVALLENQRTSHTFTATMTANTSRRGTMGINT